MFHWQRLFTINEKSTKNNTTGGKKNMCNADGTKIMDVFEYMRVDRTMGTPTKGRQAAAYVNKE